MLHIFTIYIKPLSFRRSSITNLKRDVDGKEPSCCEIASAGPSSQQISEHADSTDEFSAEGKI
jgi:hypothetical protein